MPHPTIKFHEFRAARFVRRQLMVYPFHK